MIRRVLFLTVTFLSAFVILVAFLLLRQPEAPSCAGFSAGEYRWVIRPAGWLVRQVGRAFAAPGIAVAVAVDGSIVWSEGFGYADLKALAPACPTSLFRVGSLSKPITAAAIAKLSEAGRLDLDAPIRQYVPEFPDKGSPITIRQLLGHTGGIRHNVRIDDIVNESHYETAAASLEIFEDDPLLFPPGTRHLYSSYGYNLLGAAIEGISGKDYPTFMSEYVFQPLAMSNTRVENAREEIPGRVSFYEDQPGGVQPAPFVDLSHKMPSGGLLSSPEDLARFASAIVGNEFLKPDTTALLFSPICPECPWEGEQEGEGYGFGWVLDRDPLGNRLATHTGATVGGSGGLLVYLDRDIALAITMNVGSVTSPDPQLHSFPPDPQWIALLFLFARWSLGREIPLLVAGLALIAAVYFFALAVKRRFTHQRR
jgi:CubicO group peptidase (beta-lactamase class C family)